MFCQTLNETYSHEKWHILGECRLWIIYACLAQFGDVITLCCASYITTQIKFTFLARTVCDVLSVEALICSMSVSCLKTLNLTNDWNGIPSIGNYVSNWPFAKVQCYLMLLSGDMSFSVGLANKCHIQHPYTLHLTWFTAHACPSHCPQLGNDPWWRYRWSLIANAYFISTILSQYTYSCIQMVFSLMMFECVYFFDDCKVTQYQREYHDVWRCCWMKYSKWVGIRDMFEI